MHETVHLDENIFQDEATMGANTATTPWELRVSFHPQFPPGPTDCIPEDTQDPFLRILREYKGIEKVLFRGCFSLFF